VEAGRTRFHRGEFHAAHEAWEEGWRAAQGPERLLLQALVQLAAGFHQWSRGKPSGAATLLARARARLGGIPSALLGVEVAELELRLGAWEESAAAGEPAPASPRLDVAEQVAAAARAARCPYCGERVSLYAEPVGVAEETYVEDCPVCCRPWTVHVNRVGTAVAVTLAREDD
jgi:predicted metal-dependent hydrolase